MKEIKDEFVTDVLAVRLKALGYDDHCFRAIYTGNTATNCNEVIEVIPSQSKNWNNDSLCVSIPTWQSAFEWFRLKHNMDSEVNRFGILNTLYGKTYEFVITFDNDTDFSYGDFVGRDEAQQKSLEKLCEFLENRKKNETDKN